MTPRQRYLAARSAYVGVVLLATLADLNFSPDLHAASGRLAHAFTLDLSWRDAADVLRNLALFAGLGAVWVVTTLSGNVRREVAQATAFGFSLSAMVEGLQTFSPVRTASVIDVVSNTLGAFAGAALTTLLLVALRSGREEKSYLGVRALAVAGPYLAAVLGEALTPLLASDPIRGASGGPLSRLQIALEAALPLSLWEIPLFDVPLFAAGGFLAVVMLREYWWDPERAWRWAASRGAPLLIGAHVAHGLAALPIHWEAAATHAISFAWGAWAAHRWLPSLTRILRGAARARVVIFAYMGLLVLWGWRPLMPQTDGAAMLSQFTSAHLVPLRSLSERVDVYSAVHVAQGFLLYVPLGALLAVWPLQMRGRWTGLRPALVLAIAVEAGHVLLADRYLDVTNALLAVAGLLIGWTIVRRSGFAVHGPVLRT